jgi:hypothetical protein
MRTAAFVTLENPVFITAKEILPWVLFAGMLRLLALYFVETEQGATSIFPVCTFTSSSMTGGTSWGSLSLTMARPREPVLINLLMLTVRPKA